MMIAPQLFPKFTMILTTFSFLRLVEIDWWSKGKKKKEKEKKPSHVDMIRPDNHLISISINSKAATQLFIVSL